MKISGIYKITNIITSDFYIGSSFDVNHRFMSHKNLLKKNKHHSVYLQNSWNKYGENNFIFDIIEICPESILLEREQHYLDNLKPIFNMSKDSSAPMKGRKHKKETLEKYKGRKVWNKGIPRTEQEKQKMSNSKKGKKWSEKQRQSMVEYYNSHDGYWKGKEVPKNIIEKIVQYGKSIRQKILCIETNKIYNSQLDAAKDLNIKQGHISEVLNGKRPNVKGYTFKKL